jgi:hypothetical protein
MRGNQDKRPEDDNVALPLTHRELLVVMNCLAIACESERTDVADKQIAGVIGARIARFDASVLGGICNRSAKL